MRDPARIERILEALGEKWKLLPDWRLGQLIVNLTERSDPFYIEDEELETALGLWNVTNKTIWKSA